MLDIQILSAATATVLRFDGELTTSAAGAVRAAAHRLRRSGGVTVDLGGVEKVDRPGLAALVALLMKARSGTRSVRLRGATPAVQDLLRREGIDRLFPIQPVALPATG